MVNKTATQDKIDGLISLVSGRVDNALLTVSDARFILEVLGNVSLRYEEIRKSRDKWRKQYEDLKNEKL